MRWFRPHHLPLLLPRHRQRRGQAVGGLSQEEAEAIAWREVEGQHAQPVDAHTGLKALKELKGLQSLDLWGIKITDAGLKELKELTGLQTLGLGRTAITDAGLKDLKELKGLQMLLLNGTKITDAGLKDLKQALPKTEVSDP